MRRAPATGSFRPLDPYPDGVTEMRKRCIAAWWPIVIGGLLGTLALVGCEMEPVVPPTPTPTPPAKPPPASDGEYAGVTRASLGDKTDATLHVKDDGSFTMVSVTRRATAETATRRLATAAGTSSPTYWVVFTGTATDDGTTVTLVITGVERDGATLSGSELDKYTSCSITATIGADVNAQVMKAVAECLNDAGDVQVPTDDIDVGRDETTDWLSLLVGTWKLIYSNDVAVADGSQDIEFTEDGKLLLLTPTVELSTSTNVTSLTCNYPQRKLPIGLLRIISSAGNLLQAMRNVFPPLRT